MKKVFLSIVICLFVTIPANATVMQGGVSQSQTYTRYNKVIDKIDGLYTDRPCISRKSTNRRSSIQNNDNFDFLSLKSHSIINKTPGARRISNFFLFEDD